MKLKKIIQIPISVFLLLGWCMGIDFLPLDGQTVNYTQIFFRWPQIVGSNSYEITLDNDLESRTYVSQYNSIILDDFAWGEEYFWEACGRDEFNNIIDCNAEHNFIINSLPLNYPGDVNVITYNDALYNTGITVLDYESLNFSLALDVQGEPIWFTDRTNFPGNRITVTEISSNGNFIGYGNFGYEFNLDSDIIFQTNHTVHHSIIKSESNTYFSISGNQESYPCPEPEICGEENMIWKGDIFKEVNSQGEVLWEWDTFDYLSLDEYNSQWINSPSLGEFDWTHSNSVFFDNNIVYVSMRNLSRITAIDYTTKEIIWNLGNSDFMDEAIFIEDFGFSHQHSAQVAGDGNILFFDNGRGNDPELSRCLEIEINDSEIPELVWEYTLPDSMMTLSRGECDRLANGNTLISAGRTGNVIEVNQDGEIVWHLRVKRNNGLDVSIYRSERVPDLYPLAFSFEVTNLEGSYPVYSIQDNTVDFNIVNKGWSSQVFKFELFNDIDILVDSGEALILPGNEENFILSTLDDTIQSYSLHVFTDNRLDLQQIINFEKNRILGDLNEDSIINILDILIMVNIILGSAEDSGNGDINNDDLIDILDIVGLVNMILEI